MSSFLYNDPFWNFFDNINDEVNSFNRLLNRLQRQQTPKSLGNGEADKNSKEVSKREDNGKRSLRPFSDPFFSNSLFNFNDDDVFTPPIDVVTKDKSYELHVSTPGAPKDNITIDFNKDDNELIIKGTIPPVKSDDSEGNEKHYSERTTGKFERRIVFPTKADGDNIKATFENGVLKLDVPKLEDSEENKYKRILISSSESYSS